MSNVAWFDLVPERENPAPWWLALKRASLWAAIISLLVHIALVRQLPDLRAPVPAHDESEFSFDIEMVHIDTPEPVPEPEIIPEQTMPMEATAPVADTAAEQPIEERQETTTSETTQPSSESPAPTEVITAEPQSNSLETWNWRQQLLQQGQVLAPKKTVDNNAKNSNIPQNWNQPLLPDTSSWLDPYSIPGELKQETWTETDGTVRMEVTLPNGQRMCGRAQPPDPLQPLSFSIPTWTTCGKVRRQASNQSGNPFRRQSPKRNTTPQN